MVEPRDIVSVSELQDTLRSALHRVQRTGRPIVVTQRGKPAGILMDVEAYAKLVDLAERAELEEDIARGEHAIATGDLHDWDQIKRERLGWLLAPGS
ncbi:MAG: type II toxin-antitoxin system Phd/YefM family antitoxin [Chloroflexi bacterium]|nr:type II toxin-antitoxin system Phd/YefM family antitoxin [Chloroflexota bacterium]